jgi:hypothetical protein
MFIFNKYSYYSDKLHEMFQHDGAIAITDPYIDNMMTKEGPIILVNMKER